jgi:hypothetical protein
MARRSILISTAVFASVLVAAVPQASLASGRHRSPAAFCAKAHARFIPGHVDLGGRVDVNVTALNCSTERERVPLTWRISGPCHPRIQGSQLLVLHRSEGAIMIFHFRPACAGQYRLAVKVFHGAKLVDNARRFLRVSAG